MTETSMWLFPLVTYGLLGLVIYVRSGIRWLWGYCLQNLLILLFAGVSFYFLYAPPHVLSFVSNERAAAVFSWLAWLVFGVCVFGQRMVLGRLMSDLSAWRLEQAEKRLWLVRLLAWGPPAELWTAITRVLFLYRARQNDEAELMLEKWRHDKRLNPRQRSTLLGYIFQGRMVLDDYDGVIAEFEQHKFELASGKVPLPYDMVARAYADRQRYVESLACIQMQLQTMPRSPATEIDSYFVPFFSLSGQPQCLSAVLDHVRDKGLLPQYARLFWMARSYAIRGETEKSIELLLQAKAQAPESLTVIHERIDNWLNKQQQILESGQPAEAIVAPQALVDEAWKTYKRAIVASEIMRPPHMGFGLRSTLITLVAAFIITNPALFLAPLHVVSPATLDQLVAYENLCNAWGQLDSQVWRGQWWRLLTHMLLHGNTAHLALNAGALFLFGKTVETMYGTGKYFVIFFLSGFLGGILQLLASPNEPAIGASGAILGVFGAVIAGLIKLKHVLPPQTRKLELRFMVIVAGAQVIFDQLVNNIAAMTDKAESGARIAAFAHAGGIIGGFVLGMILPTRRWPDLETVDTKPPSG